MMWYCRRRSRAEAVQSRRGLVSTATKMQENAEGQLGSQLPDIGTSKFVVLKRGMTNINHCQNTSMNSSARPANKASRDPSQAPACAPQPIDRLMLDSQSKNDDSVGDLALFQSGWLRHDGC